VKKDFDQRYLITKADKRLDESASMLCEVSKALFPGSKC
jgi:hypothetical protein